MTLEIAECAIANFVEKKKPSVDRLTIYMYHISCNIHDLDYIPYSFSRSSYAMNQPALNSFLYLAITYLFTRDQEGSPGK